MSKSDFIKAYIISAIMGYVNGRGRVDIDQIIEDANLFFEKLEGKDKK